MTTTFICDFCNTEKVIPDNSVSTGYGLTADDKKMCFECCGKETEKELAEMKVGGKTYLYFDSEEKTLVNWPGSFEIKIKSVNKSRNNFGVNRYDFWFNYAGNLFWGCKVGDNSDICRVQRIIG